MIRISIVGMGIRGHLFARAVAQNRDARLAALSDVNPQALAQATARFAVPGYADCREMLEQERPDALIVATPDFAHCQPVLEAARRGIHLLVEKPLATTVAEAEQMLEAVERAGVCCQVAFENRWNPAFVQAKAAVASGELGQIELMSGRLNDTLYVPTRMVSWAARSTVGWFLLPHLVDLALWLGDKTPAHCYASATKHVLPGLGVDTWDAMQAILSFDDGTQAAFETCWILPTSLPTLFDFKFEIVGQHGALFIDTQDQMIHQASQTFTYPGTLVSEIDGCLRGFPVDMVDSFIACLVEGRQPTATAEEGVQVTRIVAAMHESAQRGQVMFLQ